MANGRTEYFQISASVTTIGRQRDVDLIIPNQHVSRHHAKIAAVSEGYEISDLGSTYGTFVNDQRVERQLLNHGDRIRLGAGDLELCFLLEQEGRPPAHTTQVPRSLEDLGRVLPSAASDLEKVLCLLDIQYQWNQSFTPENGLVQILQYALKISGAERACIMIRKDGDFGYGAGMDRLDRMLSEGEFQTSRSIVAEVVAQGKEVFMIEGIHGDFAAQASIVALDLRAIACMPLHGFPTQRDTPQIIGILYLDSRRPMHSLSGLDQKILGKLAVEAGGVLERVEMIKGMEQRRNLERDLALAEETQQSLLPRHIPNLRFARLKAFCRPTRYVGGDFYYFHVRGGDELIGVLADVSGKGIAASLLSSMLLGCLQILLSGGATPAEALGRLNRVLQEKRSGKFVTMFLFSMNAAGQGVFINAGHNPAYLYRAKTQTIEELSSNNIVVGAFDVPVFNALPIEFYTDDVLLAYSDGLTDSERGSEMFGESRVKDLLLQSAPRGADHVHDALMIAVDEFTRGYPQTDDITLLIAQRT